MIVLTRSERSELLRLLAPELRLLHQVPQYARWDLLDRMLAVMPTPSRERLQAQEMITPLTMAVLRDALRGELHLRDDFPADPQLHARRFVAWANGPTLGELPCQTAVARVQAMQTGEDRKEQDRTDDEPMEWILFNHFAAALAEARGDDVNYRRVTFAVFVTAVHSALTAAICKNAEPLEWPSTIENLAKQHAHPKPDKHLAALRLLEEIIKLHTYLIKTPHHRNNPQRWQRLAAMAIHAGLIATPLPWGQDEAWET